MDSVTLKSLNHPQDSGANKSSVEPIRVQHDGVEFALIIPADFRGEGVQFFTPDSYSQQIAFMHHHEGKKIDAHVHNHTTREVLFTQEVLVMRRGTLRVDFYSNDQEYIESRILNAGDTILLIAGGHGFEVIEEVEMIEIKQGPYLGVDDKVRFTAIDSELVKVVKTGH